MLWTGSDVHISLLGWVLTVIDHFHHYWLASANMDSGSDKGFRSGGED